MTARKMPEIGESVIVRLNPKALADGDEYLFKHDSQTCVVLDYCVYCPFVVKVSFQYQEMPALVHVKCLQTMEGKRFKLKKKSE